MDELTFSEAEDIAMQLGNVDPNENYVIAVMYFRAKHKRWPKSHKELVKAVANVAKEQAKSKLDSKEDLK